MSAKKLRTMVPKNDGSWRVEYLVVSPDGGCKSCSPLVWSKLALEDTTPPRTAELAAEVRYKADRAKRPFGRRVEDNQWLRANPQPEGQQYRALCEYLGLKY